MPSNTYTARELSDFYSDTNMYLAQGQRRRLDPSKATDRHCNLSFLPVERGPT
jgi:hypothetical protein